jgi:hypothetical protein
MTVQQVLSVALGLVLAMPGALALAQHSETQHNHAAAHDQPAPGAAHAAMDHRVAVTFPAELRTHTLANMRDHLLALQQIQAALASGKFDQASNLAEQRLGMSSLTAHGAHEVAQYMPQGMQNAGSGMHRSASRLAKAALDASVTNDVRPALAALADVTGNCVACHAGYRLQ